MFGAESKWRVSRREDEKEDKAGDRWQLRPSSEFIASSQLPEYLDIRAQYIEGSKHLHIAFIILNLSLSYLVIIVSLNSPTF